jgi:hypothetical protein
VQSDYAAEFVREHGCTEAEWLGWLPGAVRGRPLAFPGARSAEVALGDGALALHWRGLPFRTIGAFRFPRLEVHYRFDGVDARARGEFMRYFDLYMQRGGG